MGHLVCILLDTTATQSASSQVVFAMRRPSAPFANGPSMDNWESFA